MRDLGAEIDLLMRAIARRLTEACGGQQSAALIPGIRVTRHQAYSEYGSNRPEHRKKRFPFDVFIMMTLDSRSPVGLRAIANLIGFEVVRLPPVSDGASLNKITGQAMKETADVFAHLGAALDDGLLSRIESKDVDDQIDEAVDKLMTLKACVAAASRRDDE